MRGENTPHYIFIEVGFKRFVDLLRDPWAAKPWIALFHFDDRLDEFGRWAFGPGFSFAAS